MTPEANLDDPYRGTGSLLHVICHHKLQEQSAVMVRGKQTHGKVKYKQRGMQIRMCIFMHYSKFCSKSFKSATEE